MLLSGSRRSVVFPLAVLLIGGIGRPASAQPRAVLSEHVGPVTCLVYSADGKTLASGGKDGTVKLWDAATLKVRATLPGHVEMVTDVAFAPDGRTLASASHAREIRLWEAATGKVLATLRG